MRAVSAQTPAQNQTRDWAWCRGDEPERLFAGCSAIVASTKEPDEARAVAFFNRGRGWSDQGAYDRAIADFESALHLLPNFPEVFNSLGVTWAARGDLDRAVAEYDQAIRLDPNYAIALFNRGLALQAGGRKDEAEQSFARARTSGPRLVEPRE